MEEKNCELLFEYLRSILYDAQVQPLDVTKLDAPFQKLGKGLQYLDKAIREMKEYSEALSRGNLSQLPPPRDNFLCENLKNMHANLNHLTWQAKQVAKGDYSQTVSFLGEFSEAFNTMTAQLQEREESLKEEAEREKAHADMVENYNHLLQTMIKRSKGDILVTDKENPGILYASSNYITKKQSEELFAAFLHRQEELLPVEEGTEDKSSFDSSRVWEAEDSEQHFYRITTARITWQGEPAYAHIIFETTEEKLAQGQLEYQAYFDKLTRIGNRHYFYTKVHELLKSEEALSFCYCDLDHLKYINDTYGHREGDSYLCSFVESVKSYIREDDIFARMGGDEFCMILRNCSREAAAKKLRLAQEKFKADSNGLYDKNFSFGIIWLPQNHGAVNVDTVLQQADVSMYEQKKIHREREREKSTASEESS